jgi:hypothetical protein
MDVDVPSPELRRDCAQLPLERRRTLVHGECDAADE